MEFENVNSDFTINNLSRALPDIVIQNYEFRGDLTVEYLDSIDPYLPKESSDNLKSDGLIINGRFSSSDEDVDIERSVGGCCSSELSKPTKTTRSGWFY